ncbi:transcription antitermination factor NusB, partial [Acidobacteria bacterium AH-259-L09]|nr:transcription antitermination factor NusB [Acidobacteria bacterium AH-259-L09]
MSSRRKARELALQLLFQQDLSGLSPAEILDVFWKVNPAHPGNREFAEFLFKRSLENRSQIDNLIRGHTEHWRLERMAVVDRNILRMAVSEFLYAETPKIVVIDEAIEIARKFSTEESTQFVNGVLDAIRKKI